jgi:hypothetical protein
MSSPKIDRTRHVGAAVRAGAAILTLAGPLAACSNPELYLDNRDAIALDAGDAIATNQAMQTYDPWPPHSGNVNYGANGQKMQAAVERYRTNVVTQPVSPMLLQNSNQMPSTAQTAGSQNPGASNSSAGATNSSSSISGGSTSQ